MSNKIGIMSELGSNTPAYPTKHNKREIKLAETIINEPGIIETFNAPLVWSSVDQEGHLLASSTPAAGDEIAFRTDKHNMLYHVQSINGTATHALPYVSADGLELNVNDAATDGVLGCEIAPAGILPNSKSALTVGDDDFVFECAFTVDDISSVTELALGLRKAEAFQVAVDNYDEMAAFNIGADADGQVEIHTILNNAATTETDTTETDVADGDSHTVKIIVRKSGKCEFFWNGATPAVTQAFSFDVGEVLVPFIFLIKEGATDPGVSISSLKCGKL